MLGTARDKAGAELGEYAEVEARVGQLEAERVFPVDAGAHGVGGLPIAEVFEKLQDRDQSEPPRRQAGLTSGEIEVAEVLVLVKGAELIV